MLDVYAVPTSGPAIRAYPATAELVELVELAESAESARGGGGGGVDTMNHDMSVFMGTHASSASSASSTSLAPCYYRPTCIIPKNADHARIRPFFRSLSGCSQCSWSYFFLPPPPMNYDYARIRPFFYP